MTPTTSSSGVARRVLGGSRSPTRTAAVRSRARSAAAQAGEACSRMRGGKPIQGERHAHPERQIVALAPSMATCRSPLSSTFLELTSGGRGTMTPCGPSSSTAASLRSTSARPFALRGATQRPPQSPLPAPESREATLPSLRTASAQGWQLCEAHVRALLDELAETRSPFARAA